MLQDAAPHQAGKADDVEEYSSLKIAARLPPLTSFLEVRYEYT